MQLLLDWVQLFLDWEGGVVIVDCGILNIICFFQIEQCGDTNFSRASAQLYVRLRKRL